MGIVKRIFFDAPQAHGQAHRPQANAGQQQNGQGA